MDKFEADAMSISDTLILQNMIEKDIDIIQHQGCNRFDFINNSCISQNEESKSTTLTQTENENEITACALPNTQSSKSKRRRTSISHYALELSKRKKQKGTKNNKTRYTNKRIIIKKN